MLQKLVNYFFKLKGWNLSDKEYKAIYPRYTRTAKKLLEISDFYTIKWRMHKLRDWAESRELEWTLDTVLKKWIEIDSLKIKEKKKKLYYRGDPVIEKHGKKYVIVNGDFLEFAGDNKDIQIKYE